VVITTKLLEVTREHRSVNRVLHFDT
jgi:hypothetical protein